MKKANENQINELEIIEPKHNFIIVYDSVYKNTDLNADEIALLIKLLSASPNFKPTSRKLESILHITSYRLTKASKGLQEKGYLKIENLGKGKGSKWTIKQEPIIENKLTYEDLIELYDIKYYERLYKLKYISLELEQRLVIDTCKHYKELIENNRPYKKYLDDDD